MSDEYCGFCYFDNTKWSKVAKYTSWLASEIEKPNTEVVELKGIHEDGKADKDVEGFIATNLTVQYFPRALGKIYANLTHLSIEGCSLKEISRNDLLGLENLEHFEASFNKLTSLPNDLFIDKHKLRRVYFDNNKILRVSSQLLEPVKKTLEFVTFFNNIKLDDYYAKDKHNTLENLMKSIDAKCRAMIVEKSSHTEPADDDFGKLLETGNFSDFTIVVDTRKIKVHKCVLANRSLFFEELFANEGLEVLSELEVKEFSGRTVDDVLHFLYFGSITEIFNAMELFGLATKLKVPALIKTCQEMIVGSLDISNAIEVLSLGHVYSCQILKQSAFEVIANYLGIVLDECFIDKVDSLKDLVETKRNFENILAGNHQETCLIETSN